MTDYQLRKKLNLIKIEALIAHETKLTR